MSIYKLCDVLLRNKWLILAHDLSNKLSAFLSNIDITGRFRSNNFENVYYVAISNIGRNFEASVTGECADLVIGSLFEKVHIINQKKSNLPVSNELFPKALYFGILQRKNKNIFSFWKRSLIAVLHFMFS